MSRSIYARLHRKFGPRPSGAERARKVRRRVDAFRQRFGLTGATLAPKGPPGEPRVAVIGGGFAGLAAGWYLSYQGATVTLYEATARLGGRVWSQTTFTPGRTIEFGGELIGYNHPAWVFLAEGCRLGLSMLTSEENFSALGLDMPMIIGGDPLSDDQQGDVYQDMLAAFQAINADAANVSDPYAPWDAALQHYDTLSLGQVLDRLPYKTKWSRKALEAQFANNNGAPSAAQSYLANLALVAGAAFWDKQDGLMSFWDDTEVARCAGGNMALAVQLATLISLQQPGAVRLGTPVTSVKISGAGVAVTAAGQITPYDCAILAVPPSVWPAVGVAPAIPADYYMTMGTVVKFLSTVDQRFWLGSLSAPSGIDDAVGMTWEGTDNQIGGPGYELSLFAGGPAAQAAIDSGDPWSFYSPQLEGMFPGYGSSTTPARTYFVNWEAQPFIEGGYSCPAVGEATKVWPHLASGWNDRLFFAGEHTCPAFFGYMEGALESGLIAAWRILQSAPSPTSGIGR